jgi:ATP-dependent RNA helicase DeaD
MNSSSTQAEEAPRPPLTFDALALSPEVRKAIDEMGYKSPTPVQVAVFEPIKRGKSLVVQARTGTGKTAAFGLPILDGLIRKSSDHVQALILVPTRELALQVARELERIGVHRGVRTTAIYGGASMEKQIEELRAGVQVVSGTPGRVLDHLRRGTLDASNIRIFVLDEADEMLSMGFAKELHAIVELLPKERQGLFFSATIPPDIERLANAQLKDPEYVTLSSDQVGALQIAHFVYLTRGGTDRKEALLKILEVENPESAIVFCNTKHETELLAEFLKKKGYDADWLNGDLDQRDRERVMGKSKEGKLRFLVATDVAARGIDISHLTHVINADFPENPETYVHRTGRTGRAGRTGTAVSVITPKDMGSLYLMRLTYKIRPIEKQLPSAGELKAREESDLLQFFVDAYGDRTPAAGDLALARRLLTHDLAERVIAGLLRDHLGGRDPVDVTQEVAEARRAKNPAPVPAAAPPAKEQPRQDAPRRAAEAEVTARPATAERPARRDTKDAPPRDAAPREPRGRARARAGRPHAELVSWEHKVESDDDRPIMAPAEAAPRAAEPRAPRQDSARADAPRAPRQEDPNVGQLFLNVGKRDGVHPREIEELLTGRGGLAKDALGSIRIRDRNTFVDVPKAQMGTVIDALAGALLGGRPLVAEIAKPRE